MQCNVKLRKLLSAHKSHVRETSLFAGASARVMGYVGRVIDCCVVLRTIDAAQRNSHCWLYNLLTRCDAFSASVIPCASTANRMRVSFHREGLLVSMVPH